MKKKGWGQRCHLIYEKEAGAENACIIPLILFSFIENAFKHGTTAIKPSEITIRIKTDERQLQLYVRNEIHHIKKASTLTGLENTRRRLELLYPEQYSLDIREEMSHYIVQLELNDLKCHYAAS